MIQTLWNGTVAGATFALFAVGFTLIFGIHRILNLAHGYVFTWGALAALFSVLVFDLPWALALVIGAVVSALLTVLTDFLVFQPLDRRGAPEAATLIASIGAGLVLQSLAQQATRTEFFRFPERITPNAIWNVGGVHISSIQIVIVVTAVLSTWAIWMYLNRTKRGVFTRAVAEDPETASLVGVSARSVRFMTFLLGGAFAGVAGVLIGTAYNTIHFMMGEPFLLLGMAIVTLGGMGSVTGAFIGALVLGIVRELTLAYVSPELSDALPFLVLFLVLVVRPEGLFRSGRTFSVVRAGRL